MNESITYQECLPLLIEQCKKGNSKAFKELYYLYCKPMYNICFRMLNEKAEAEDALQESFISAFKNIGQFTGNATFGSWLKRIVINRCIDILRKRDYNFVSIQEQDLAEEEAVQPEEPVYTIENIREAIGQLPDGYRVILSLYLFEDYTHKMIAEKLSISEGTSKSQYFRARKKLTELITLKNKQS